jgi:hypothetical protein
LINYQIDIKYLCLAGFDKDGQQPYSIGSLLDNLGLPILDRQERLAPIKAPSYLLGLFHCLIESLSSVVTPLIIDALYECCLHYLKAVFISFTHRRHIRV